MADVVVDAEELLAFATEVLSLIGCDDDIAAVIAEQLVGSDLRGVHSHGTMRLTQYARQGATGYLDPVARPSLERTERGRLLVKGNGGFGHPAMSTATAEGISLARRDGSAVIAVVNCGHTGRIGAYAEMAAGAGMASIITGGGQRERWRQVAPHGGAEPKLPTNPWAFGFPGTSDGPVVADFATGMISGGATFRAAKEGRRLPGRYVLHADGVSTDDPKVYLEGGAIRPFAGPKGYGMGLITSLLSTALLGHDTVEGNWIIFLLDTSAYRSPDAIEAMVAEVVADLRSTIPAPGFDRVEIPGQREHRLMLERRRTGIPIHPAVWRDLEDLHARLVSSSTDPDTPRRSPHPTGGDTAVER